MPRAHPTTSVRPEQAKGESQGSAEPVDWTSLCAHPEVAHLIALALAEDVGDGDVTTAAIFTRAQMVQGHVKARRPTVVCGVPLAEHLLRKFDPNATVEPRAAEGQPIDRDQPLFHFTADVRAVLTIERCLLNFLMRLCGVAQNAHAAMSARPTDCPTLILDTRKTLPGWRRLDKAAVRTGGAANHRMGLYDAVLIKDNHLAAAGSITEAVRRTRDHTGGRLPIEVEIDSVTDLEEAITAGADIVLLDNLPPDQMASAVKTAAHRVALEASGGIGVGDIARIARLGVDRLSLGALTHTVPSVDLSLEIFP